MPFGLVRLRTFRLAHGLVRCKHERRCSSARGEDASFTDVKIKSQIDMWAGGWEWRHAPEVCAEDFGDLKNSQLVKFLPRKKVDFRGSPRPGQASSLRRGPHVVWGRWKSQHRKIVYLSPHVEKPFNSKVIKRFVPELRSRKCYCVSGFLCALWTYYVYFTYSYMAMWQIYLDVHLYLSLVGIILRWGFLIWELIFIYCGLFFSSW